jgi:hypothetical protein
MSKGVRERSWLNCQPGCSMYNAAFLPELPPTIVVRRS